MPTESRSGHSGPAIPLSRWADRKLCDLAEITRSAQIAALDGQTLLAERGSANGWTIPGKSSAGIGGSRLLQSRDGKWFALTVLRDVDRELLPALFLGEIGNASDQDEVARAVAQHDCDDLVGRGRDLGLPVASADETPQWPPIETLAQGPERQRKPGHRPLVIDLSAIWAGPLAGHLLGLADAEVVKVESATRPDLIRRDDPATYDVINQGKANVAVDLSNDDEKAALIALIGKADIVIESSRPRALWQLGIDADALVRATPGLVWLSITGHGATGDAANWAGIGNDCSVAAGLSRALADVTGELGYVGDAITDPLTGITAASAGWDCYMKGEARRIGFAMSAIGAQALAEEQAFDRKAIDSELRAWGDGFGEAFPRVQRRALAAPVHDFGADTEHYLCAGPTC